MRVSYNSMRWCGRFERYAREGRLWNGYLAGGIVMIGRFKVIVGTNAIIEGICRLIGVPFLQHTCCPVISQRLYTIYCSLICIILKKKDYTYIDKIEYRSYDNK